ncbi:tyrosine-type recombinase/integrase [Geoalkalibacter sp.]|uniref:tyrosine-type recombinase/integrase n=1 Tax=Geoalkalibacter sp. TaxID=3041440 RepID=UPI00272E1712|nr:tyrosine-type recombinase/integrase [Geoalkalibacter sp.]
MMDFETAIHQWRDYLLVLKGQQPRGVARYEASLRSFVRWYLDQGIGIEVADVQRSAVADWMKALYYEMGNLSNRSRASKLSAVRSFFRWAKAEGISPADPTRGIPSPKIQPSLPQKFSTEELRLLFSAPDLSTPAGLRDLALLKTLYASGVRVSELVALDLSHLVDTGGYIRLKIYSGKGGKHRTLTLRRNPSATLREWLVLRRGIQTPTDALFIRMQKEPLRLSAGGIQKILKKYARIVGIPSAEVFCHKMRSTFATDLYDSGHDKCPRCSQTINYVGILELAALMGHDDPKTTMGYVAISERTLHRTAIPDKRFNDIEKGDA